jgi:hypothetical protein
MSQHDYVIENQTFPATRTDLNNAFGAIVSQNSGATAPSTTYAFQLWYDTTANKLKQRNADNDAWIDLFDVDQSADTASPSTGGGGTASFSLFEFTATSGQTTFSGADDNSATLSYSAGKILVIMNGVTLDPSDFTATNGTSVVLASGAAANDLVNVYAFDSFSVADTVSAASGGTFNGGITVSGDLTVDTDTLKVDSTNNRVGIVNASPSTALDVTGDITVSGGIYVGGTGSANYMNDYEEGTFTAQMFDDNSGGNASSTTNTGYYTKIGQLVSVTFSLLNISTSGLTGSNVAYFTLPFTASLTKGRGSGAVRLDSVTFGGGRTQAVADVGENGSRCRLLIFGDGAADQSITVSDFNGTSSDISALSLVYITDS